MSTTAKPHGISTAAAFLGVLAAGCASARASLLLLAASSGIMLGCALLNRILRPLRGGWSPLLSAVLGTALAGALHLALLAFRPAWWEETSALLFYLSGFLAGALAAKEEAWEEALPHFGIWAAFLLLLGCLREWLAAGTLMGVRLQEGGWSSDFGVGGLGLVLAGLFLAFPWLRERHAVTYSPKESLQAGGLLFLCTAAAGLLYALCRRLSLPVWAESFLPALLLAMVLLVAGGLIRQSACRAILADPALAALGYALIFWQRRTSGAWYVPLGAMLGAALLAGAAAAALGFIASRLDGPGLPRPFRTLPVLLMTAGLAFYAFAAF